MRKSCNSNLHPTAIPQTHKDDTNATHILVPPARIEKDLNVIHDMDMVHVINDMDMVHVIHNMDNMCHVIHNIDVLHVIHNIDIFYVIHDMCISM